MRSGIGSFDLIDNDKVCLTNLNRQIIATRKTIGRYFKEKTRGGRLAAMKQLDYRIIKGGDAESVMQTDLIILYLLEGEMRVNLFGDTIRMKKDDILLVNPGTEYEISRSGEAILGMASYSVTLLSGIMGKKSLLLYADSARDALHTYQDLRDILQEMTAEYILNTHQTSAAMDSMLLRLLDCLIENYQLSIGEIEAGRSEADARMQQMMQYITTHIHEEINLSDLAAEMFVSTSTLSRMFKKHTGMYFADYVMRLRVRSSLGLLRASDQNLTQIAMNSGFSTSAAFNRSFKKVTGMMPSEYRKKYQPQPQEQTDELEVESELREELRNKGYQYIRQDNRKDLAIDLNDMRPAPYRNVWSECVNIGSLYELSRPNTQFHVLRLQEHLRCRYIRVWNVFSDKMMISDGQTRGQYNFDMVNQVLDFLVAHRLKPFFDMGRRPDTAIRAEGKEIYYREEYISFASREIWEDLFAAFLTEILGRYGLEEVSTWVFEISRDCFHEEEGVALYADPHYNFWNVWTYFYRKIREMIPGALLGGISSVVEHEPCYDYTLSFYRRCIEEHCRPDFATFGLYPYEMLPAEGAQIPGRMMPGDRTLERNRVLMMRRLMEEAGLTDCALYISEWNNSIGNRNHLNDSCFRAAYFASCAANLWGQTDLMAVMAGTDWVSSYIDTNKILNGGIGLLTKDTIGKPAFYALSFLNHMGSQFLGAGENYILTRQENGDLYLLLFHFSWYRRSAATETEEIDLSKLRLIRYEDERTLELKFLFRGMAGPGEYTVKKRSLNKHSGSILDEWAELGYETRLSRDDVKYLQAISVPRIEMERVSVNASRELEINAKLAPEEVALLHIYRV